MAYALLAELLVLVHAAFVAFVLAGGLGVAWRAQIAYLHLPAVAWAVLLELNGWICPLTPWEQELRRMAGQEVYAGGFVEHYVLPLLYPAWLTPRIQTWLAGVVVIVNALVYAWVWHRHRRRGPRWRNAP